VGDTVVAFGEGGYPGQLIPFLLEIRKQPGKDESSGEESERVG